MNPDLSVINDAGQSISFMNMPLLTYIKEISPRPILLIAGENAHSPSLPTVSSGQSNGI